MSRRGRKMVVMMAMVVQIILGILYGFSNVPISAGTCFIIWCVCAMMICRFVEAPKMV